MDFYGRWKGQIWQLWTIDSNCNLISQKCTINPDSKQSLGQRWVMVVIVGVLTLAQYLTNTKVSTFEILLLAKSLNFNYAPMMDFELWGLCWPKNMLAENSRVIFLNIKFILITQKLYYLLLGKNSVILFYNNNFMIYLVILTI